MISSSCAYLDHHQSFQGDVVQGEYESLGYSLTVFPSPGEKRFPLLLVLHGREGTGREYLELWKGEAGRRNVMVLSPTRRRGYHNDFGDLKEFYELVDKIVEKYPVDKERIYLAGTSAGSLIAQWLVENRPSYWRGVILISSPSNGSWISKMDFRSPALLFVHGARDPQSQVEEIRQEIEILKKKDIKVSLLIYPNGGHEQRPEWSREIFNWIED